MTTTNHIHDDNDSVSHNSKTDNENNDKAAAFGDNDANV